MAMDSEETISDEVATADPAAGEAAAAELLSDEERDALMAGVESGEVDDSPAVPAGEAVAYDLANQDRIIRGRLPVLEKINTRFVRYLQGGLESMLQQDVDVSAGELETVRISDYIHSLAVPTSLNFIAVDPLPGECLFAFDPALVFSIVDIYFGGDGRHVKKPEVAEFTPTESHVTRLVINRIFQDLKAAWEPLMGMDFKYIKSESNPQFSSIAASKEMMIVCSFHLGFGEYGGDFQVGLPVSHVQPIRGLLEGGRQKSKLETEKVWLQELQNNMAGVTVELWGKIADTELRLRDVFNLQAGDVIPVEMPELVTLQVDDVPMFSGRFGVHGGRNAVRINNRVTGSEKS